MNRRTLGRGLQALLGMEEDVGEGNTQADTGAFVALPLDEIETSPFQPRRAFDEAELAELVRSIEAHGVVQPIVVRLVGGRYQLVAGERRFRAARSAGLTEIPARVMELDDRQTCELALIENLQRTDLGPIEKARAFADYLEKFGATHERLAEQLGVDRSTVTNFVRLLELPTSVVEMVEKGAITFGHARALLSLDDPVGQIALAKRIVEEKLSVRQIEALVKSPTPASTPAPRKKEAEKSHHVRSLEDDLRQRFGARVEILPRAKDKGSIVIHFASHEEFERLLDQLKGK